MSEERGIIKAAGILGLGTTLSRVLGLIRDMVIAHFFGAGLRADAFFVAFRIPNVLRRLVAEGSLTIAFIPVFTEDLKKKSKKEALELANISFTLLTGILALLVILGIIGAPWIVKVIAPGFGKDPYKIQLTILLTKLVFPYIFFISLVGLCMGILNSFRHFAAPAFSPVLLNLSLILCVLLLSSHLEEPVLSLALGVLMGGMAQLLFQIPFLRHHGMNFRPNFHFNHPSIKKMGTLLLPSLFGFAVYQINIFVSTLLASFLPTGSVSYLYYADRLFELPLGIFVASLGSALLPTISGQIAAEDWEGFRKSFSFTLRMAFFTAFPAMVGLMTLCIPITSLLFFRGEFHYEAVQKSAQALFCYALGLVPVAASRVMMSAFYSMQDTKTPVKIAFVAFLFNLFFSLLLMKPLKHSGLALATSLSSYANMILLFRVLKKRVGQTHLSGTLIAYIIKIILASAAMGFVALWISMSGDWEIAGMTANKINTLASSILVSAAVFFAISYVLGIQEMKMILGVVKDKIRGKLTLGRRNAKV